MNTLEIETILKNAPQPKAPAGLQERLCAQAARNGMGATGAQPLSLQGPAAWIRRWWPVLAPTALSLACATVFTFQQLQIRDLKAPIATSPDVANGARAGVGSTSSDSGVHGAAATAETEEISRLEAVAARLSSEISQLEQMRGQNEGLRKELAARAAAAFSPEEAKALQDAQQTALSIQCINNMKQLGLAVRIWAVDHGEITPPAVQCLTNETASHFQTFVCPADSGRAVASSASSFSAANCSYDYLAPATPDNEPNRVLFRCPIHGNIGLMDGSVQKAIVKEHPDWLVQKDGKLYMEATSPGQESESQPAPANAPNL